jgi:hypothetical protein
MYLESRKLERSACTERFPPMQLAEGFFSDPESFVVDEDRYLEFSG